MSVNFHVALILMLGDILIYNSCGCHYYYFQNKKYIYTHVYINIYIYIYNYTKYDQLHSMTLFSKDAIAVRLVRGTFSRALIMGIILYHK